MPTDVANALVNPVSSPNTPAARDGPFGLERGQDMKLAGAQPTSDEPGWYTLVPPKPHPDFTRLSVAAPDGVGLCRILALGATSNNEGYGDQVRSTVDRVADQLTQRYGPSSKVDYCDDDASTCRAGYWSMHVANGSRRYGYSWSSATERSLPNRIQKVEVFVAAGDTYDPYPVLQYWFDNAEKCEEAMNQQAGKAL